MSKTASFLIAWHINCLYISDSLKSRLTEPLIELEIVTYKQEVLYE
ncbi:MAG TPA: hypothetical protein DHV15_03685 [Treponema sp.]|uniref:Uncharacterized protein n=1 Tax=Treponema denticola (strain ATCC 35405 / DSM 14222 / CIP 103919 / JCM 8153 / KCTC 15104) TaxID=243275 RepID=Q73NX4_TREDE|nr:hypothetical protein TDE_1028 [Treponema denticola ATCC 35405]UTY25579.1 hypothetical protein E4N77_01980 [Treponema denticola]HCY94601.1 hypothetical protein [Treponema sp.]